VLVILATTLTIYAGVAGNLEPANPPDSTFSYTLEDIYSRLASGAAGMQSTFTEPGSGPGVETMHTLNDIMGLAPEVDDTDGATAADVVSGKTFWGLNSGGWGLQTGTLTAGTTADIPKTGQTTPYTTGDDGDLQMGVPWPVPRFITGTTGVVTDSLTGLIWLEDASCAKTTRDWSTALLADISQLNALGTMNGYDCGDTSNGGSHQTDWRLPNVREMQSLVHYGVFNPSVPNTAGTGKWSEGDPFTGVQPYDYWSSTTRGSHTSWAWSVDMINGEVKINLKTGIYYVWPVRGGQ
jgi:hypothetical protein